MLTIWRQLSRHWQSWRFHERLLVMIPAWLLAIAISGELCFRQWPEYFVAWIPSPNHLAAIWLASYQVVYDDVPEWHLHGNDGKTMWDVSSKRLLHDYPEWTARMVIAQRDNLLLHGRLSDFDELTAPAPLGSDLHWQKDAVNCWIYFATNGTNRAAILATWEAMISAGYTGPSLPMMLTQCIKGEALNPEAFQAVLQIILKDTGRMGSNLARILSYQQDENHRFAPFPLSVGEKLPDTEQHEYRIATDDFLQLMDRNRASYDKLLCFLLNHASSIDKELSTKLAHRQAAFETLADHRYCRYLASLGHHEFPHVTAALKRAFQQANHTRLRLYGRVLLQIKQLPREISTWQHMLSRHESPPELYFLLSLIQTQDMDPEDKDLLTKQYKNHNDPHIRMLVDQIAVQHVK